MMPPSLHSEIIVFLQLKIRLSCDGSIYYMYKGKSLNQNPTVLPFRETSNDNINVLDGNHIVAFDPKKPMTYTWFHASILVNYS